MGFNWRWPLVAQSPGHDDAQQGPSMTMLQDSTVVQGHVHWNESIEMQSFVSGQQATSVTEGGPAHKPGRRRGGFSEPVMLVPSETARSRFQKASLVLLQQPLFVFVCHTSLVFSLIAKDAWNMFAIPSSFGDPLLYILLLVVTLLFLLELVAALSLSGGEYCLSPFFIVDLLSIVSVMAECYGVNTDVSLSMLDPAQWKFFWPAYRSICMLKLMKVVSYFNWGIARLPKWHPNRHKGDKIVDCFLKAFAQRVPLLTVFLLAAVPFIKMDWNVDTMTSMDVWMASLQKTYRTERDKFEHEDLMSTQAFQEEISRMEAHYNKSNFFPYSITGFEEWIRVGNETKHIPGELKMRKSTNPVRSSFKYVEDTKHCVQFNGACDVAYAEKAEIHFDITTFTRMHCGETVLMHIFLLMLIQYVLWEVGATMKELEDMERFANMSRVYMKSKHMELDEYESLAREEKGILQLMGCESRRRRSTISVAPVISMHPGAHSAFVQQEKELIESWDLDVCEVSDRASDKTLVQFQEHILTYIVYNSHFGSCCRRVRPDLDTFTNFTAHLRGKYNNVPYHGYSHACDVAHTVYRMITESMCDQWLNDVEKFSLLVAALGHDVGHFGKTNDFLVKSSHALAIQYNDQSPLENMHCSTLFNICGKDNANMFKDLDSDDYKQARKLCIAAILHTDMVHHPHMQKHLVMLYERTASICDAQAANSFDLNEDFQEEVLNKEHEFWLHSVFVHVADVSNPTKPFTICRAWAERCLSEFWAQGDEEKTLGLPVGMLNDRDKVSLPGSQHGFINFLVAPVFVGAAKIFHRLLPLVENMADNMKAWRDVWVQEGATSHTDAEIAKRDADIARLRDEITRIRLRLKGRNKSTESRLLPTMRR